ncbi:MAG: leucine-rich repeat protein, partial [Lachnospiraceae bacterium]|nr:leucine-rich repeat protein [Lachnospiraceae bacterium]
MTAITAAVLAALILLCTGCGGSVSSLLSPARAGRTVRVVIEDNPQMQVESSVLTVEEGSDLQFAITPAQHCTVRGTDYRDYSLDPAQDGQYICTLHDVLFDTMVSVLTEENPYTIRYEANGAAAAASSGLTDTSGDVSHASGDVSHEKASYREFSYPAAHLRVNTEQGTHLFERENCILTGWNTAADGSGQHIGLGSRVRVGRGETLTLYAEWAICNDASDFLYEKGANSVTITGFNGWNRGTSEVIDTSEVIVIPSRIDGLPVTGIAQGAFQGVTCDRVVLPPTISFVEVHAFDGCTLSELVLFDSVSEITDHAFAGCENLRTIRINACVPPGYSGS